MTRYAIVRDGRKYRVVPDDRIKDDYVLVCYYSGHILAARKLADQMADENHQFGRFRPTGKKLNPIFGWKE